MTANLLNLQLALFASLIVVRRFETHGNDTWLTWYIVISGDSGWHNAIPIMIPVAIMMGVGHVRHDAKYVPVRGSCHVVYDFNVAGT